MSQSWLKVLPCLTKHRHIIKWQPLPWRGEVLQSGIEVSGGYVEENNCLTPLLCYLSAQGNSSEDICHWRWGGDVFVCGCACWLCYSHVLWGGINISKVHVDTWASLGFGCIFCSHSASLSPLIPSPKSGRLMVAKHAIETSACQKGACVGSAAASSP